MIIQRKFSRDHEIRYCFRILKNNRIYLNSRQVGSYATFEQCLYSVNLISKEEL